MDNIINTEEHFDDKTNSSFSDWALVVKEYLDVEDGLEFKELPEAQMFASYVSGDRVTEFIAKLKENSD